MDEEQKYQYNVSDLPPLPFFSLDMARELGTIEAHMKHIETDVQKLDAKFDRHDEKFNLIDIRLSRLEDSVQSLDSKSDAGETRLDNKIDVVELRLLDKIEAVDARVDKCLVAINRMDERMISMGNSMDERFAAADAARKADVHFLSDRIKSSSNLSLGLITAVLAGVILQFFFK